MTIKTRFALSNALMVLVSLVLLLSIGGFIINTFEKDYYRPDNMLLDENADNVKAILEKSSNSANYEKLASRVKLYGYSLYVMDGAQSVYSNDDDTDKVKQILMAPDWKDGKSKCMVMDGATIVGVKNGSKTYVAVKGSLEFGKHRQINNANKIQNFLIAFIIIGVVSIILILIASQIYSKIMIKRVMNPVALLTKAARQIENGDLTQQITYINDDEFKPVIKAFNSMQLHLMREREKTASYEKARTDMIAGISHDLRTPLTSIKGYIKGISDGVANTPEKEKQYLDIAYRKSCDMEVLLKKLFYFSKLETGNMPLNLQKCDLARFASDFVNEISYELKSKNAEITFECKDFGHTVMIDKEQISRVLYNLVDNSIKYSGIEKDKKLMLKIKVWKSDNTEHLAFSDNGNGVPDIMLDSIFECFFRVDEARGFKNGEGSGLGLHIVKYIAQAHKGDVKAYNNNGLVSEITLPHYKENNYEQNIDS